MASPFGFFLLTIVLSVFSRLLITPFVSSTFLSIRIYDKGDDFYLAIINFPHLDSNIVTAPTKLIYI